MRRAHSKSLTVIVSGERNGTEAGIWELFTFYSSHCSPSFGITSQGTEHTNTKIVCIYEDMNSNICIEKLNQWWWLFLRGGGIKNILSKWYIPCHLWFSCYDELLLLIVVNRKLHTLLTSLTFLKDSGKELENKYLQWLFIMEKCSCYNFKLKCKISMYPENESSYKYS